MDGFSGVSARVAELDRALRAIVPPAPAAAPAAAAPVAPAGRQTFQQVLVAAQAARLPLSAAPATPAAPVARTPAVLNADGIARTSAVVNADGVPVDLAAYGNGKVPATALTPIGVGRHRMWTPAAKAFTAMQAAAAKDGVRIGVTDSYRSYAEQVDVARRKGLYSQGGLAARPGTSEHGWGLSLDLDLSGKALAWMRQHAHEHGFSENVPREPWHWTFSPS